MPCDMYNDVIEYVVVCVVMLLNMLKVCMINIKFN